MQKISWVGLGAVTVFVVVSVGWNLFIASRDKEQQNNEPSKVVTEHVSFEQMRPLVFGSSVVYESTGLVIDSTLQEDFNLSEIQNLDEMEKAYDFKFSDEELSYLAENKFVLKNLLETNILPSAGSEDNIHELAGLYKAVRGNRVDLTLRGPENSLFFSTDVFFDAFNNIYTELLKEMENKEFYPAITKLSKILFEDAETKLALAQTAEDIQVWTKVRNYFAVPYALFSTAVSPLTEADYYQDGYLLNPSEVISDFEARDKTVDTYENTAAFVQALNLDAENEEVILKDLQKIFKAEGKATPEVFSAEYEEYTEQEGVQFVVDFSQFTPRGTYTSSSLRREYFRGVKWFGMVPFFLKSENLTHYAYAASELLGDHPDLLNDYNRLEAAIAFLVGTSDDLMPLDYLQALAIGEKTDNSEATAYQYLVDARNPKIKDLSAVYSDVGTEQSEDVLLKTKSMRFFSSKFILDAEVATVCFVFGSYGLAWF